MTEWNALGYEKISALQQSMAAEVLATLDLQDAKQVVDLGWETAGSRLLSRAGYRARGARH